MNFPAKKIDMGLPPLALGCAVFIAVAHNGLFWSSLLQVVEVSSLRGILSIADVFILIAGLLTVLLLLLGIPYVFKPVVVILFVISSLIGFFEGQYGIVIDRTMIQNIIDTDYREAGELLTFPLLFHMALFGVLPALALSFVRIRLKPFARELSSRLLSLALAVVVIGAAFLLGYKNLTLIGRNHSKLRLFMNPGYPLYSAYTYLKHKNHRAGVTPIGMDARQAKPPRTKKKTLVVFVVGETAREKEFSLNGYARQTNPYLEHDDVISFTETYACGTSTAYSLPCMFSHLGKSVYSTEKAAEYENVLDVLAHAGVTVLWRDNNSGCKGVCSRVDLEDMAAVAAPGLCSEGECFDEVLLYKLQDYIKRVNSDALIVLHQRGSHGPAYSRRHPSAFSRFTPECTSSSPQECENSQIINAYDNTIVYTDYFLHKTIALLKKNAGNCDTMLMYFSDHGESLGENGIFLHGLPAVIAPDEQKHIPFILWLSDGYAKSYHVDKNCLAGHRDHAYSHDNIFHSLLGAFGITTELYKQDQDILNQCTDNSPPARLRQEAPRPSSA
jgi:lipid A ethanolaminephosphotransferase